MSDVLDSIPARAMTNHDLIYYAKKLKLPHFRGVFSRDTLPRAPLERECGFINLSDFRSIGSHWVAYIVCARRNLCLYYNSYGGLPPSLEFYTYVKRYKFVLINKDREQYHLGDTPTEICGQLALRYLYNNRHVLMK
jgi:hypothetical protein